MATVKRRKILFAAIGLLGILCLSYLARKPMLRALGNYLVVSDPLQRADAIAVLSGNGTVRGSKAAELYFQKWAPKILITKEGYPYRELEWRRFGVFFPETDVATVGLLRHLDVPASDMEVLEGYNESTVQEAGRYLRYAQAKGLKRLIVITSNFHTRRSRVTFGRVFRGSNIDILMQAGPAEWDYNPQDWWTRRLDSKTLVLEYQKFFFYCLRYW